MWVLPVSQRFSLEFRCKANVVVRIVWDRRQGHTSHPPGINRFSLCHLPCVGSVPVFVCLNSFHTGFMLSLLLLECLSKETLLRLSLRFSDTKGSGRVENVEHVQVSPDLFDWVQVRTLAPGGSLSCHCCAEGHYLVRR